jgi:uncharacterized protein
MTKRVPQTNRPQGTGACLTRRKFLVGLGLMGTAGMAYARFLEPTWIEIGRPQVRLGAAPGRRPLKILHLSDLHASSVVSLRFLASAFEQSLALRPDLICLTGDFISEVYDRMDAYAGVLGSLARQAPTFACLGNHDGGLWAAAHHGWRDFQPMLNCLARSGIQVPINQSVVLSVCGWNLNLVGVGDIWAGNFAPWKAFASLHPAADSVTIVLCHNPDSKDDLQLFPWDLMLSGHTHGGQINLPGLGTPFAPVRDKRFIKGLHRWEGRWLHITKGVGNMHGVRFNCRPEISLLTLT